MSNFASFFFFFLPFNPRYSFLWYLLTNKLYNPSIFESPCTNKRGLRRKEWYLVIIGGNEGDGGGSLAVAGEAIGVGGLERFSHIHIAPWETRNWEREGCVGFGNGGNEVLEWEAWGFRWVLGEKVERDSGSTSTSSSDHFNWEMQFGSCFILVALLLYLYSLQSCPTAASISSYPLEGILCLEYIYSLTHHSFHFNWLISFIFYFLFYLNLKMIHSLIQIKYYNTKGVV